MTLAQTQLWVVGDFQSPAAGGSLVNYTPKNGKPEQSHAATNYFFSHSLYPLMIPFGGVGHGVFKNSYYILEASRKGNGSV